MFANMDTDNSGTITYEELKTGLARIGSRLSEAEVKQLMEAVSSYSYRPLPRASLIEHIPCIQNSTGILALVKIFFRLMLMGMDQLTILNSSQLQCIGTGLNEMNTFTKHSSILIRITVGEYKIGILVIAILRFFF